MKGEVKLTETQAEVLSCLEWSNHKSPHPEKWCRPMDIGGSNGSHHSGTLAALSKKGFVQFKQRHSAADPVDGENGGKLWRGRGSKVYRITPAGCSALAAMKE